MLDSLARARSRLDVVDGPVFSLTLKRHLLPRWRGLHHLLPSRHVELLVRSRGSRVAVERCRRGRVLHGIALVSRLHVVDGPVLPLPLERHLLPRRRRLHGELLLRQVVDRPVLPLPVEGGVGRLEEVDLDLGVEVQRALVVLRRRGALEEGGHGSGWM